MAEKFIEQLNLFPKRDINKALQGKSVTAAKRSLFEKRFNLSYLGDSGATVQDLGHHAGYYHLPHTKDARMFYFFFKSRRSQNDPVVIWLTGGPGCSSELAVIYENGMNSAGTRKTCDGDLCYDFSNMENFLNDEQVKHALGVGDIEFVSCSSIVYQAMQLDWMRNLEAVIPPLLEDGIKLLVYAGEYDLIFNWLGNSRWVHAMEWSGLKDFGAARSVPFTVDGEEKGIQKNHGPVTFLRVHDAGHMVPMDQPCSFFTYEPKY
ncbi:Serine carboxypeptidase 3 [Capsicum chinense]|nr:Serine carboxypeptidase 3 [Capsicum chinense]